VKWFLGRAEPGDRLHSLGVKKPVQKDDLLKQTTNSIPMNKNARAAIDNAIRKATFFNVVENIPIFSSWLKPEKWDR
jgi:hypothetical protein